MGQWRLLAAVELNCQEESANGRTENRPPGEKDEEAAPHGADGTDDGTGGGDITVREIAELADVNRGTFYAHYRDVNDLLAQVEESVFLRLEEISVTNRSRSGDDALFTYLTDVMTLCRDSADIYRALVIRNNDIDFQQRLLEALKSHYMRSFVEHSSSAAERDQEYFCSFAVHGMLSMTNDWMESGLRETPEEIARYGADFILRGLQGLN